MIINYLEALQICNILKGKKIQYISRSLDLVSIGFGDLSIIKNKKGIEKTVATYSLHLQCPFRITNGKIILIGSEDLYISFDNQGNSNLDEQNTSLFDIKIKELSNQFVDESVTELSINQFGDLIIQLSNFCIFVFIATSNDNEEWRFFKSREDKEHLVVSGMMFEI